MKEKWPFEAKCFTPWLSKNLDLLSAELGMDLELVGTEVEAGPFRADLVACNREDGNRVVIENQLTHADSRHLGQLLHYHVKLKARTSVWVAPKFWGTNLSAIHWLNDIQEESTSFFAVRVSVYPDLTSNLVPALEVIEYPRGWKDRRALEFWGHVDPGLVRWPGFTEGSSCRRVRHRVEEAQLYIVQYFKPDGVRVYLTGHREESDEVVFSRVKPYRNALKSALDGAGLMGGKNPRCTTQLSVNTHDRGNWKTMAVWLREQKKTYEKVLRMNSGALKYD